jgi:peptidoglycan/LPS O-acetylase OafA/YrhL
MTEVKRIESLDLLRSFAILFVVFLHANHVSDQHPQVLKDLFSIGWIGVDLFFVLSGFLIGKQVMKEDVIKPTTSLWNFWIKRWTRTLPLYFVVLSFYALVKPLLGYPFVDGHFGFVVFFQNYMTLNDFVQSWSLCIEEQFYIVLPIIAFVFKLQGARPVTWLIPLVISIVWRFILFNSGEMSFTTDQAVDYTLRFKTHLHLDGLSLGLFLASTFNSWPKWTRGTKIILGSISWILIFSVPLMASYHLSGFYSVITFSILAASFSIILVTHYHITIPKIIRLPVEKTALWSYGIYLWNHIIIRILDKVKIEMHWFPRIMLFIFLSYLVALITYYIVEKPGLKLRRFLLR